MRVREGKQENIKHRKIFSNYIKYLVNTQIYNIYTHTHNNIGYC